MANDPTQYAETVTGLGKELGLSSQALHKSWLNRKGFPSKTKRGFNVERCRKFIAKCRERKAKENGNGFIDLKQEQLRLRNLALEEKIAREKGERMPVADHLRELQQHAQIVTDGMRNFIDDARVQDKGLGRKAEKIARRILRRLQRAIKNA